MILPENIVTADDAVIDRLRNPMTIGIVAACDYLTERTQIIMCSDRRISGPLGRADVNLKIRPVRQGWFSLYSGPESDCIAFYRLLRAKFKNIEIDEANLDALVRECVRERKEQKNDDFVGGRYAMTYKEFVQIGKDKFPPEVYRDVILNTSVQFIDVEAIITGFFNESDAVICRVAKDGKVSLREHYATIGEGASLATAALMQREQSDTNTLAKSLYNVFEAKKFAERVPSVGDTTTICFGPKGAQIKVLLQEQKEWLEARYSEFGPKDVPYDLEMPSGLADEP